MSKMTKELREENVKVTLQLHYLTAHVVTKLEDEYNQSKGVFPTTRYELLKTMIKKAIRDGKFERIDDAKMGFGGATAALKVKGDAQHDLKRMSPDAIRKDTEEKKLQIQAIRSLETDYAQSKALFPLRRYFNMKTIVRRQIKERSET